MTPDQIVVAATAMHAILAPNLAAPRTPARYPDNLLVADDGDKIAHCLWMLAEIPQQVQDGRAAKAMRWLCFVQGVAWTLGLTAISPMKDMNR